MAPHYRCRDDVTLRSYFAFMRDKGFRGQQFGQLALQICTLLLLVFPFVSSTFRDNDQATLLGSGWQLAHHQTSFLHATFYNFDKQWLSFLALSWLFRLFPHADPVLAANVLVTSVASLAWISLGIHTGRTRRLPWPLLLPVLLSPVLILYMPFLGTGWLSLALLLLAFFFLGKMSSPVSQLLGVVLVAVAASFRGDVVLAVPALTFSLLSRARFQELARRPLLWSLLVGAILPVLLGKLMAGATIEDSNPISFDLVAVSGFLLFGFTPALFVLLFAGCAYFASIARRKHRFRLFYLALALAPFIPLAFYSTQLYTLRYLFLTIASVLFVVSSRRSLPIYRSLKRRRLVGNALIGLAILPWIVGLRLPLLSQPLLTFSRPTRFPTGDGRFPMGAYLGFAGQVLLDDHLAIDHNQKIWLAARSVRYDTCPDGSVPFLITPMSNFIEFAIRLQNKAPRGIDYLAESACGMAYVDARSILRGYRPVPRDRAFFHDQLRFVSQTDNGQLIVRVDSQTGQTDEASALEQVRARLGQRDIELFIDPQANIPLEPGLQYAVFSAKPCHVSIAGQPLSIDKEIIQSSWKGTRSQNGAFAKIDCPGKLAGWARTVLPPYIGR